MLDLVLAIAHHLAVFALIGIFAAEFALLRQGIETRRLNQLASVDAAYGAAAGLVIIVGVVRVIFGAAGWEYYAGSWVFWAKMMAFAIVGLLSIVPTMRFIGWDRQATNDPAFVVPAAELATAKSYIRAQAAIFLLIPVFAAAMARGYGL